MSNEPATQAENAGAAVRLDWDESEVPEIDPGHDLLVEGYGLIRRQHRGPLVAQEEIVSAADLDSLKVAIVDSDLCCSSGQQLIYFAPAGGSRFDYERFEQDPVYLAVDSNGVHARFAVLLEDVLWAPEEYRQRLDVAAQRYGCRVASFELANEYGYVPETMELPIGLDDARDDLLEDERGRPRFAEVRIDSGPEVRIVAPLIIAGRNTRSMLLALRSGELNAVSAADLVRAGLPHLLLGYAESEWLEVKRGPYDLGPAGQHNTAACFDLAKDVAALANGDCAAVLILGIESRRDSGTDRLSKINLIPAERIEVPRYQDVIDGRVYPTIDGIQTEYVPIGDGGGLVVISVPRQAAAYQPFIVHGVVRDEKIDHTFISIPARRGSKTVYAKPSQFHALLASGRAVVRPNPE